MNAHAIMRLDPHLGKDKIYFENKVDGINAGLCHTDACNTEVQKTSYDEFVHILEGSLSIVLNNGHKENFSAGQTFVIPKGLICGREQSCNTKFYYMRFEDETSQPHDNVQDLGVIRLNPSDTITEIPIPDTSQFQGLIPKHYKHSYYTDTTGRFLVAMWNSDPFEREVAPFNRYELMIFLKGSVTLSDNHNISEDFNAHEAAFVPYKAPYKWKSEEYLSKYYCIIMPK